MSDDSVLSAADIARLAGVGRAAVSNWRKRYPDFPEPVPESGAAPAFRSDEVQQWLRDQGKLVGQGEFDALWHSVETHRGQRDPLEVVGEVAAYLAGSSDGAELPAPLRDVVTGVLVERRRGDLVEALCSQLFEPQQRQH